MPYVPQGVKGLNDDDDDDNDDDDDDDDDDDTECNKLLGRSNIKYTPLIYAPGGIRKRNPSKRVAADPRHRPRGHRGRRIWIHDAETYICFTL